MAKKMSKSNPLKFFNDQADARNKSITKGNSNLVKAQYGTAFQSYLANVPGSTPSDTLGRNDPRGLIFDARSDNARKNAQAAAFQATYGKTHGKSFDSSGADYTEQGTRVPQTKKTVKSYTKDLNAGAFPSYGNYSDVEYKKRGGQVKSKKK